MDVLIAIAIPLLSLIMSLFYLFKPLSRNRGYAMIATSIVAWIIWVVICSLSGGLRGF